MTNAALNWNDSVSAAVERSEPGVVHIDGRRGGGLSGAVWSDNQVLTSHRGLGRRSELEITLADGTVREAKLVGRDPGTDVALLEVDGGGLTPLSWGELGGAKVGHATLALGRPGRAIRASLRIIGVLADEIRTPRGGRLDRYVETDRRLPYGFSGGPLIDLDGQALGLNTRGVFRGADIAVPTETLRRVVDELSTHGTIRRGFLGVGVQAVRLPAKTREQIAQESGALVVSVAEGGAADSAGLMLGDVIVTLDEEPVHDPDSLRELLFERAGQSVSAAVLRAGSIERFELTVGER